MRTSILSALADSCVGIDSGGSAGSGSIIAHVGRNSYVLTCEHVVSGAKDVEVIQRIGKKFVRIPAVVERVDAASDLALVRTARRLDALAIPIAECEPELYAPIATCACPAGLFGTVSVGILTGGNGSYGPRDEDFGYLLSGVYTVGGASGGALVDIDGCLFGVVTATKRKGGEDFHGFTFACPLPNVRRFLARDAIKAIKAVKRRTSKGAARL